jgi:hypothetical protein
MYISVYIVHAFFQVMKFKDRHKDLQYCVNYINCISFGVLIITEQISVAARSKDWVFGRSLLGERVRISQGEWLSAF